MNRSNACGLAFKRTLHSVPSAPELVFERVVANVITPTPSSNVITCSRPSHAQVFALTTPPESTTTDDDLKQSIADLQNEITFLNSNLREIKDSIAASKASNPGHTLGGPSFPRATPIKFAFTPGPYGTSTRAEPYNRYDGLYGAGCHWSDLKLVDRRVQSGTFNTIEIHKSEPMPCRWQHKIEFATPFRGKPEVVVWLTGIDMRCDRPCHVKLSPVEIRETCFEVHITSSEDGVWHSLGISWAAWPRDGRRYSCSLFDMVLCGTSAEPGMVGSHLHRLPERSVVPQKTVLAVRKLAMGCGGTMPFLMSQPCPAKREYILCDLTTDKAATGMYVLGILCIACSSAA